MDEERMQSTDEELDPMTAAILKVMSLEEFEALSKQEQAKFLRPFRKGVRALTPRQKAIIRSVEVPPEIEANPEEEQTGKATKE